MNLRILTAAMTALILSATIAAGDAIYTWIDEKGVRHMSNILPVDSNVEVEIMEIDPPQVVGAPMVNYTKPESSSRKKYETKVSIVDNHVIVPVTLTYNLKKVKVNLLLDTGSSNITLHREVAKKLNVKNTQKGSIRVAGGDLIDAEGVVLNSVTAGPHTKNDLLAGIIDHTGPNVPYEGLLGMNFLKSFPYTIDFNKRVLRWKK
jgi:predicted aspartyl protease